MITEFADQYSFLSNFWPAKVEYEDDIYPSVEHAFQAAKFPKAEREAFFLGSAAQAKKMGRTANLPTNWEEIKVDIMKQLVISKFSNEWLKTRLLFTGHEELQEGNMWHDTFWGIDLRTGKGRNELGKILMEVRESLR